MLDAKFLVLLGIFAALSWGFVILCDRVRGGGQ